MVYHNPTAVTPRRTGVSFLLCGRLRQTQRQHLQNSSHARIAREAQHDAGVVPGTVRGAIPHLLRLARRLPRANLLDRASAGARSRRESARAARRASRKREKPPRAGSRPSSAEAGNKIEQGKMKKDPTNAWTDLYDFAAKIRAWSLDYSEIEDFDVNSRLKWTGMLSRFKRTPGRFMMRLRTPNGVVKAMLTACSPIP